MWLMRVLKWAMTPSLTPSPLHFQKIATLGDIAMDFTLENWEQQGRGKEDLFWDTAAGQLPEPLPAGECHPAWESPSPLLRGSPMALWHLWGDLLAPGRLRSLCSCLILQHQQVPGDLLDCLTTWEEWRVYSRIQWVEQGCCHIPGISGIYPTQMSVLPGKKPMLAPLAPSALSFSL